MVLCAKAERTTGVEGSLPSALPQNDYRYSLEAAMKWIRDSPSESWSDKNAHLLLILVGLAVLSGLGCDRCGYALEERSSPPDGSNRAVILQPDCRATTDLQSHVSLLSIGKRLAREKGNVFIADGNHGVIPFDSHGVMDLDAVWKSDSQIENHRSATGSNFPRGSRVSRHSSLFPARPRTSHCETRGS